MAIRAIGIDFDNTIVIYDHLFYGLALEKKLIGRDVSPFKKSIRDTIRQLPGGDVEWQKLQAMAYGANIGGAKVADGVLDFIKAARKRGLKVFIISHKTQFSNISLSPNYSIDLRRAALTWLKDNGFFDHDCVNPSQVIFAGTREEKIEKICDTNCEAFIDDLEETFLEPSFPPHVQKYLFLTGDQRPSDEISRLNVRIARSWKELYKQILNE